MNLFLLGDQINIIKFSDNIIKYVKIRKNALKMSKNTK